MSLTRELSQAIELRRQNGTYRTLPRPASGTLIDFASNDYLGLARQRSLHEAVVEKMRSVTHFGSTGSRLLTGNLELAEDLEAQMAQVFGSESGLLFSSGYTLNRGVLGCLGGAETVFLLDECAHASMKDGARSTRGSTYFFRHNDAEHLRHRLGKLRRSFAGRIIVGVESLYSMDGDQPPLHEMVSVVEEFGAYLIVDEAHGIGTLGATGLGLVEELGLSERVFARVVTFGKALGSHGAMLLGPKILKDYCVNFCPSFIYTTALSTYDLMWVSTVLDKWDRWVLEPLQALRENIALLDRGPSPITCLGIGQDVKSISAELKRQGFWVLPIVSPTVKRGTERLRVCLHSYNTAHEINRLKEARKYCDSVRS